MALLVATIKPTALHGWSQYFRLEIIMNGKEESWKKIDEKNDGRWRLWPAPVERGGVQYSKAGNLILSSPPSLLKNVVFHLVHWNFRQICQRAELTGSGWTLPDRTEITWVMGVPPPTRGRNSSSSDRRIGPLMPAFHTDFKIRILAGKAGSSELPFIPVNGEVDTFFLEIVDVTSGSSMRFEYKGKGVAGGDFPESEITPTSLIMSAQPFASFSTTTPVKRLSDFTGDAELVSDAKTGKLLLSLKSSRVTLSGPIELPTTGKSSMAATSGSTSIGEIDVLDTDPLTQLNPF